MVEFVTAASTGGSLTGVTVRLKLVLEMAMPSLTAIATVVVPDRFGAGVSVTVRVLPLPPKTMLVFARRFVLDDNPDRESELAAVSRSPMTNGVAGVGVSSAVVSGLIEEIVGKALMENATEELLLVLLWSIAVVVADIVLVKLPGPVAEQVNVSSAEPPLVIVPSEKVTTPAVLVQAPC